MLSSLFSYKGAIQSQSLYDNFVSIVPTSADPTNSYSSDPLILPADITMCFLRIRPEHAPIEPPGAAPTLTTVYDEDQYLEPPSAASSSLSHSLAKARSTSTVQVSYVKRTLRRKAKTLERTATEDRAIKGSTAGEQRTRQKISESLDLAALLPGAEGGEWDLGPGNQGKKNLVGEQSDRVIELEQLKTRDGKERISVESGGVKKRREEEEKEQVRSTEVGEGIGVAL